MEKQGETSRLLLKLMTIEDYQFIKTLVNTEGWITFIGDRKVNTDEDSKNYIQKLLDNKNINYWVVTLKSNLTPIGVITLIKRDALEFQDLGFAFLPEFGGKGYAFEASAFLLDELKSSVPNQTISAITIPENNKSIMLLEKLGFIFKEKTVIENETLFVYLKEI